MSRIHRDNFIKIIKTYNKPGHDIFDTGFVGAAGGAGGVDWAGDGSDGALTASGETLSSSENTKNYTVLTIPDGQTLNLGSAGATPVPWVIYATESITINGTLNLFERGGVGGPGGGGGSGGPGGPGRNSGSPGGSGGTGQGSSGYNGGGSGGALDPDDKKNTLYF